MTQKNSFTGWVENRWSKQSVLAWKLELFSHNLAPATVNAKLCAVNSLLPGKLLNYAQKQKNTAFGPAFYQVRGGAFLKTLEIPLLSVAFGKNKDDYPDTHCIKIIVLTWLVTTKSLFLKSVAEQQV